MHTISLICLAGPLKGQVFRLNKGGPVFLFGRYSKATCSLAADPAASHLHFLIDTSDNRVRIIDLGSTNGLVINERHLGGKQGAPFTDFITLKSGDTILAGACLFRLSAVEEANTSEYRSDSAVSSSHSSSAVIASGNAPRPTGSASRKVGSSRTQHRLTAIISQDTVQQRLDGMDGESQPEEELPRVDGFTILELIGGGGKGVVYRAIKDDTGDSAAIKMMMFRSKSKRQRSIEMFRREIQITRQLHHPHIIRYLADGISGGAPFLALEYVEGGNLDTIIGDSPGGRMDLPAAVPLFIQLLEAVAYMHQHSLVHRDIKPKNVLLDLRRGGTYAIKLSDMGLSCRFTSASVSEFLPIISEGGTPAYMPPEQLTDLTRAIPQSDVFSSGATFYQMVTGRPLYDFTDKDQNETIINGEITPIRELRPDLPFSITTVIDKALSYQPENRQANAFEMLEEFKNAL